MSDEKKDVNSQQENVGKKGINKKLIIAFAGMGAVSGACYCTDTGGNIR